MSSSMLKELIFKINKFFYNDEPKIDDSVYLLAFSILYEILDYLD